MTQKRTLKRCNFCRQILRGLSHIRCCECENVRFCITCFVNELFLPPHALEHGYRVIRPIHKSLSNDATWSGQQELDLFEGLERCGIGNWENVCKYVDGHTAEECEAHFIGNFRDIDPKHSPPPVGAYQRHMPDPSFPPKKTSKGTGTMVGYIAGRSDFQSEWSPDAELFIQGLHYGPEISDVKRRVNDATLRIYWSRLKERSIRKDFLIRRGLLKKKFDSISGLLPLYKYSTREELKDHVKTLNMISNVKEFITKLHRARRNGVRVIADLETRVGKKPKSRSSTRRSCRSTRTKPRPFKTLRAPINGCTSLTPLERQFCVEHSLSGYSYQTAKYIAILGGYVNTPELLGKMQEILQLPHNLLQETINFFSRMGFIAHQQRAAY